VIRRKNHRTTCGKILRTLQNNILKKGSSRKTSETSDHELIMYEKIESVEEP
jgi:hypothetical protein